jgi:hypothetical protein
MVRPLRECRSDKSGTYPTHAEAMTALRNIRSRSDRAVQPVRAYECTLGCRGWHLTSQPKLSTKVARRR